MRYFLLFTALICYSAFSFSTTVTRNLDGLNGEFSFSEGNLLLTEVSTGLGQIDNFLRSNDSSISTNYIELSPELFLQTQSDTSLFQIQAKASYFAFNEFENDNHYDFSVLSKYHLGFAQSHKVFFTGFIADEYEYRGTGLSLGHPHLLKEGDIQRNEFLNMGYLYGHQNSLARAKILIGYRDFAYQTRKNITDKLAYSTNYLRGDFDYLITGKTYFSSKIQYENFTYDMNDDLEREQFLLLAGVKWQSTELTQLHMLFGYENALFSNNTFDEKDRFSWQVSMLWNPISRVRLNFTSGSEIKESYKLVNSISLQNYYSLSIDYDFTQRLLLSINGKIVNEEVIETISEISEDDVEMSVKIKYQWRDWLSVFAQYQYDSFDSTIKTNSYDLQDVSLGVVVTF